MNPDAPRRPVDPPGDRLFMAVFAAVTALVIGVDIFTVSHDLAEAGAPLPLWEPAVWEITSGLVLVATLPGLLWLARRVPPTPTPPYAWILPHLVAGILFSLIHVVGMGVLRSLAYAVARGVYNPLGPLRDWPYELRKDLLVYVGVLACYWAWGELRARRAPALVSPTLEVKDGTRRLFVPVDDILWVEAAGNYVELRTRAPPILHRASLAEMERRLAPCGFVRIHRSRLVSRSAIAAVETNASGDFAVRLNSGETLAGSRRFRARALTAQA